jgi:hypothetical protein
MNDSIKANAREFSASAIKTPFLPQANVLACPAMKAIASEPVYCILLAFIGKRAVDNNTIDLVAAAIGLDSQAVGRNLKLIQIALFASENLGLAVPYKNLSDLIGVSVGEIEQWLVDGEWFFLC